MKSLPETVRDTILRENLISPGDHVLAGVSGGADSVCLLLALHELTGVLSFTLGAVHVEHGLRGEESLEDAAFTERLCESLNLPYICRHADVAGYAASEGWSMEEAGRNLRREIFLEEAGRLGADKIALAHTQNDQAETVLFHLARGTGIRGMGGIRPKNGLFIHPLLDLSRPAIEQWLREKGQPWRTDATNFENEYARNRIRNRILPLFSEEINAQAVRHLAEAACEMQEADLYLRKQAQALLEAGLFSGKDAWDLHLDALKGQSPLVCRYVLRLFLETLYGDKGLKDLTRAHIEALQDLAEGSCGRAQNLPRGLCVMREDGRLHASFPDKAETALCQEEVMITEEGTYVFGGMRFRISFPEKEDVPDPIPSDTYTKWISCDTITNGLCFRHRRRGDYVTVHAGGGRKKLKDYMIDEKIPARERGSIVLLAEGSGVLWVVGYRLSEDAKVRNPNSRIMKVEAFPKDGQFPGEEQYGR